MSDQTQAPVPATAPAASPVIANATQALAIKEIGDTVAGVKKQIKTLWIAFIVLAVVTVAGLGFALGPRLLMGNRGNFRGQFNGANGTFQGPANGGTGTGGAGAPGTVPGQ